MCGPIAAIATSDPASFYDLRRRPSPALVIAVLALAGTWGGPAVAASLIGSKEIRDNSVRSKDVRDRSLKGADLRSNTITGRVVGNLSGRDIARDSIEGPDIAESTLEEVPSAAVAGRALEADRAASATVADQLAASRVVRLHYQQLASTETTTVFDQAGVRIQARCTGQGVLDVRGVRTGAGVGHVRVTGTHPGSNTAASTTLAADNDFREGDAINLLTGGTGDLHGRLTWSSPAGDVISVDFLAQDNLGAARGYQCLFAGTALHTLP